MRVSARECARRAGRVLLTGGGSHRKWWEEAADWLTGAASSGPLVVITGVDQCAATGATRHQPRIKGEPHWQEGDSD